MAISTCEPCAFSNASSLPSIAAAAPGERTPARSVTQRAGFSGTGRPRRCPAGGGSAGSEQPEQRDASGEDDERPRLPRNGRGAGASGSRDRRKPRLVKGPRTRPWERSPRRPGRRSRAASVKCQPRIRAKRLVGNLASRVLYSRATSLKRMRSTVIRFSVPSSCVIRSLKAAVDFNSGYRLHHHQQPRQRRGEAVLRLLELGELLGVVRICWVAWPLTWPTRLRASTTACRVSCSKAAEPLTVATRLGIRSARRW